MLNPDSQIEGGTSNTRMARLRRLEAALNESPHSFQTWHWRAQIKVLRFIISRYGDGISSASLANENKALPEFEVSKWPHPPKPRGRLRKILKRVEKTNELKPNDSVPANTLANGEPAPLFTTLRSTSKQPPSVPQTLLEKILLGEISTPVAVCAFCLWVTLLLICLASR